MLMNAEFSFLEYTYNPAHCPETPNLLKKLGFVCRAENDKYTSVWKQNQSVIFLRNSINYNGAGVSGLGFIGNKKNLTEFEFIKDHDIDLYVTTDPAGLRILLVDENEETNLLRLGFVRRDLTKQATVNINYISGVTYNYFNDEKVEFYEKLGFRVTKTGQQYTQLTSANNRFTIVSNRTEQNQQIQNIIFEVPDIFDTTAKCVANGVKFRKFDLPEDLDYGDLTFKIYGYNCLPFGSKNSYTIENFIPNALPNTDFILRMRKQYIDITEHSLFEYYGQQIC
jgi:4-hydroxyphenylpyruvate dioxygenase-like putative hemolysin